MRTGCDRAGARAIRIDDPAANIPGDGCGCGAWWDANEYRTRIAVEACHRAGLVQPPMGRGSTPSLGLNLSPWYCKWLGGTNASSTEGESAELELWRVAFAQVQSWIDEANRALNASVSVGVVMFGNIVMLSRFVAVSVSLTLKHHHCRLGAV